MSGILVQLFSLEPMEMKPVHSGTASQASVSSLIERYGDLPGSYLDFLAHHDGWEPDANIIAGTDEALGMAVRNFIPAAEIIPLASQIAGFPADCLPIAGDECGNYFCLRPDRTIAFWEHETDLLHPASDDFGQFLDRMEAFDLSTIKLDPSRVIQAWIDPNLLAAFGNPKKPKQ
jgi:hypothetical protein